MEQSAAEDMAAAFYAEHVEEYFFCERGRATIKKTACVERQTKGIITCDMGYNHRQYEVPFECQDCEQGRRIMAELKKRECVVEGCTETDIKARGMCRKHYSIWYHRKRREAGTSFRKGGAPRDMTMPPKKKRGQNKKKDVDTIAGQPGPLIFRSTGVQADTKQSKMLLLNFEEYPELYGDLKELAAGEMRPIDLQVMYLLKRSFQGSE
jgi:hypothetical protein